jgi:hypothetical protein
MFCMRRAAEGAFGDFVYAEGEYFHPFDSRNSDLREVKRRRLASASGQEWVAVQKRYDERGVKGTPMTYPTHSTSGPMAVMRAHALKVSALGYRSRNHDPYLDDHAFTNVTALYQMSNGAQMRICEYREVAYPPSDLFEHEILRVFGTSGTFRENRWAGKDTWRTLTVDEMRTPLPPEVARAFTSEKGDSVAYGGHGGSHAYLVHEFVDSVAKGRTPAVNAWEAVRYMAAGCAAQKSAFRDGAITEVPDWGDAPR